MTTPTATIFLPYHALDDVILRGTRAAQPAADDVVAGTLYCVTDEGARVERSSGATWQVYSPTPGGGGIGTGDVVGPGTATDGAIALYDGTTGKLIQDSATTIPALTASITADVTADVIPVDLATETTGTLPVSALPAHHATHEPGGSDALAVDAAAAVGSLRTLGTGAQQAAPGNDARFGGAPAAHATTHQPGGADAMAVDAVAATGSLRTLGTGAQQAAAGTDSRLTNARTPTAHATSHQPGGADAMAVDAVAATGSLRTLGTSATSACAGNDSRLTNSRTPTAHHATHEPGGSDALTALDAATLTTGTVPDARLSGNVALENVANVFTAPQEIRHETLPDLQFTVTGQPANQRVFRIAGFAQGLYVQSLSDVGSVQAQLLILDRFGSVYVGQDLYEKGRASAMGHWQNEPFSAALFSAEGSMTWTVASGNIAANRYTLIGRTLIWSLYLFGSVLAGTAAPHLFIQVPGGHVAAANNPMATANCSDSAGPVPAWARYSSGTQIVISKNSGTPWALGSFGVQFTIFLEIA